MREQTGEAVDTLWVNANIATMTPSESDYGLLKNAAIGVKDGRIKWIGESAKLPDLLKENARKIRDVNGQWITPGLIDCHTHLVYGGNRAHEFELRLNGVSYTEIQRMGGGILSTVKATREASEKELLCSAQRRLKSLEQEGVTTIEIKSGYGLNLEAEMKMLKVARDLGESQPGIDVVTTFLGAHAVPSEQRDDRSGYITQVVESMLPAIADQKLADAVDGFCESIAFSHDEIERVFSKAKELNLPVKIHAEQLSDSKGSILAARYQALSADHLEYISEDGVRALAKAGSVAVLLPGAFYTLRETQLPPIQLFRDYNVPIAIATDANPGSSPVFSLLLMLNMACTIFSLTPVEALAGVTRNAARALGLGNDRGVLETGKRADFVIWDIENLAELAYMLGFNACREVVKDGISYSH